MNDKLEEIAAMAEPQNEVLAQLEATLQSLGDVELAVPKAFLDELEELTTPRAVTPTQFTYALRG